jgi:hypothetical protein
MHCEWNLKLRSHNRSYCCIKVVTKAGLTMFIYLFRYTRANHDFHVRLCSCRLTVTRRVSVVKATVFPVFRLLTCEFCLSVWKIARCAVILLLPLLYCLSLRFMSSDYPLISSSFSSPCQDLVKLISMSWYSIIVIKCKK